MKNLTQLVIVMLLFGTVANAQIRQGAEIKKKPTQVKKPPVVIREPTPIISTPKTGKNYMIHSAANQMFYLTTKGDVAGHKKDLVMHNPNNSNLLNFIWKVEDAGNKRFWLEPYSNSSVRTDVSGGSRSRIYTYRKHHKTNQQFKFVSYPNRAYHCIQRVMSPNVVLEVKNPLPELPIGTNSPGIDIWAANLTNRNNQKFKFEEVHIGSMSIYQATTILNNELFNDMKMKIDVFDERYANQGSNTDAYKNTSSITLLQNQISIDTEWAREQYRDYFNYRMIDDMNLANARVSYRNRKWILKLRFEEDGTEIKKICYPNCEQRLTEYNIRSNMWEMEIRPVIKSGKFTFEVYDIKFRGDVIDSSRRTATTEKNYIKNVVRKNIADGINKALTSQRNVINLIFLNHIESAGIKRKTQFTTAKNGKLYFIEKR